MKLSHYLCVATIAAATLTLYGRASEPETPKTLPEKIDYNRDVRPILSSICFNCHGPDKASRKAKLRLDTREGALEDLDGNHAIVPGSLEKSEMVKRIVTKDPEEIMPPPAAHHKLSQYEIDVLKKWVQQGAPYSEHWAWLKPQKCPLPQVQKKEWPRNAIDNFILARIEQEKLGPSVEADKYVLIRRVSLDLTGLPPTPQEVQDFVNDKSPNAYEKVVDRLLASPAFGERWARVWLDLARYADSAGYGSDPLRLNIWPYRDWVIDAFNRNLPYDQFVTEQLAGDLLPNPTQQQLVATAFHRNTMTNTEGGTDDEEFRVAAVKDRSATTAQVFMGLTLGCAQCHSHKFDPISNKEYYQMFAIFNQTEDSDRGDEFPTLPLPTPAQQQQKEKLQAELAELEKQYNNPPAPFDSELADWERRNTTAPVKWSDLAADKVHTQSGAALNKQGDGSYLLGEAKAETDTYTLTLSTSLKTVSALRIDVLPDASLPAQGPGRASGNFVLTDIEALLSPEKPTATRGRFVRIELPGKQKMLSLAEVQVFSNGQNIATKGKATQSSVDYEGAAEKAIDGNTNGDFNGAKSTTHTKQEDNPWWEVDLGAEQDISEIAIWNRTDGGVENRLSDFKVIVLDGARKSAWEQKVAAFPNPSSKFSLSGAHHLHLKNASADFEQDKFGAALAIDSIKERGKRKETGWAIAGQTGKAHSLVIEIDPPVTISEGAKLELKLAQNYGTHHTIGRFKVSATDAPQPVKILPEKITQIFAVAADKRDAAQKTALVEYFKPIAPSLAKLREQIAAMNKKITEVKPVSVPVMRELAANKQRKSYMLEKGNFLIKKDEVQAAVLAAFNPMPKDAPMNRLGLAQWIVARDNPLTARVAVNRFWAQIFGIGIVETEEDFGTQGALPSHPELLDWMAVHFMDDLKWDIKALLKMMVTSSTYTQSSKATPQLLEKDARNRLLARAPRRRLDAEQVRDQALALSGLLSHKIGGPSVYPPQPDGLWRAAFNGERTWSTSAGEDKYRRGLYTFWRRTVPYPSMATFDAPSREICNIRRIHTNTPLQAFVTLNDPAFVECAQALAKRLMKEGGAATEERIRYGLQLCLARPPSDEQVKALVQLYQSELENYKKNADAAKKMAGDVPAGADAADAAAWTVVANILLNMDGVLMKG